ncbi:hypothetical protein JCM5350_003721 [Sporobolomyces pararoseus]
MVVYSRAAGVSTILNAQGYNRKQGFCRMLCTQTGCEFGVSCLRVGNKYEVDNVKTEHSCKEGARRKNFSKKFRKMIIRMEKRLDSIFAQSKRQVDQSVGNQGAVQTSHKKKERKARDTSFPSAKNLQDRINQLKTAIVELPTPAERFATQEELLSRLYAFSQQRSFLIFGMSHCATATVKSLKCSLNRKEREVVPQGRCQVIYTIKQNEDESQTWSLSEPIDTHSHPISEPVIQSVPKDSLSAEASSSSIEIVEPNSPLPAHASDSVAVQASTASQTFDSNVSLQDESTAGVSSATASNDQPSSSSAPFVFGFPSLTSVSRVPSLSKRTLDSREDSQPPRAKIPRLSSAEEDLLLDYSLALDDHNRVVEAFEVPRDVSTTLNLEQDLAMNDD